MASNGGFRSVVEVDTVSCSFGSSRDGKRAGFDSHFGACRLDESKSLKVPQPCKSVLAQTALHDIPLRRFEGARRFQEFRTGGRSSRSAATLPTLRERFLTISIRDSAAAR